MKRTGFIAVAGILLVQLAGAQPAVYREEVLNIPAGAVIDADGSVHYYGDIRLQNDGSGRFVVAQAEARPLVQVESVDALILESFPVQVNLAVEGFKSVPCVELLPPAISREGHIFTVALAESELGPAESCIAIIDPFETTIALDVLGLEAGEYAVIVNGVEETFVLEVDNVPLPQ